MNIKTNLFKISNLFLLKLSTPLLVFAFSASLLPQNAFAAVYKTPASANSAEDENFDKKFREGRDLIDKQDWKKAAEKFNEVINQYPTNKSVDAALYWLAFCYKKQREFEKMGTTVDRLMKDYPMSSWTSDAQVLLVEVAAPVNGLTATIAGDKSGSVYSVFAPAQVTGKSLTASTNYPALTQIAIGEVQTPIDREDEIKIAAFQSLLSADLPKGIKALSEILQSDSKASDTLKIEVLRSLRSPKYFRVYASTDYLTSLSTANKLTNPSPDLLRETLIKNYKTNSNAKIRREIIYVLSTLKDVESVNALTEIYNLESDLEIKKAIINGFGSSWATLNGFYTFNGAPNSPVMINGVTNLGQSINTTKTTSLNSLVSQAEALKLLQIARTEKNPELRGLAIEKLTRFSGNSVKSESPDYLSQIYDKETVESVKRTIILGLAKSSQPQATKKLLEIAKTEQSKSLRIEAIRALGQSKDPEALKYLEEIIK